MAKRIYTLSVVLSKGERTLLGKIKGALEKKTGLSWPLTQIMRLALGTLAMKEKVR